MKTLHRFETATLTASLTAAGELILCTSDGTAIALTAEEVHLLRCLIAPSEHPEAGAPESNRLRPLRRRVLTQLDRSTAKFKGNLVLGGLTRHDLCDALREKRSIIDLVIDALIREGLVQEQFVQRLNGRTVQVIARRESSL